MSQPLAERLRPRTLDEYIGQKHLVGEGAVLRKIYPLGTSGGREDYFGAYYFTEVGSTLLYLERD